MFARLLLAASFLSFASHAYAGGPKDWAKPLPSGRDNALSNALHDMATRINPEAYERKQREEAARATYRALLQAGATEEVACAAALNPDFFRLVAPQYLRPKR
jgi:hypothetical protein